ncbi:hypothetical protein Goshw_022198 [Gossypium schwendimanii]|uniref:Uncharacterized protein n=1 Tax=Gossypium schwendimanii TaxID=34291 RepID=A0A7J9N8X8_GOSSC|nr:hypothetical protein [Gossypium schwendimanii]
MSGDEKNPAVVVDHQHHQYGTFQGVSNYPPPPPPQHHSPAIGFPQPVPPPGLHEPSAPPPQYYPQGYQTVPGYAVAEGRPVRERRLPCCGIGCGWFFYDLEHRVSWDYEEPLLIRRLVEWMLVVNYKKKKNRAVLATIAIILGVTKGIDD